MAVDRELIEKLKAEYEAKKRKNKRTALILLFVGIGLIIGGIMLAIFGGSLLVGDGNTGAGIGALLGGIFMAFFAIPLAIVPIITVNVSKPKEMQEYIKKRMQDEDIKDLVVLKRCPFCDCPLQGTEKLCPNCKANL
jgi:hypothetical protein